MYSNQTPLTSPREKSAHNFSLKFADWEASVFDNASYFTVINMRLLPRSYDNFVNFEQAYNFAKNKMFVCIYAITKQGRSVLLDKEKWQEWLVREKNY